MELTIEQQKFIDEDSARIVLTAPAGTGKTETIAARAARIEDQRPLITTFTHSAEATIKSRLGTDSPAQVRTITSLAVELVRSSYPHISVGDGTELLRPLCASSPVAPKDVINLQSCLLNDAPIETGALDPRVWEVYGAYKTFKATVGYADYLDCLTLATDMSPAHHYGSRPIIVDEAQDLTPLQWRFLQAFYCDSLVLAGDADQSIYSWAGVDANLLPSLAGTPRWTSLHLTESFRCPQGVLPLINAHRSHPLRSSIPGGSISRIETTRRDAPVVLAPLLQPGDVVIGPTARRLQSFKDALEKESPNLETTASWSQNLNKESVQFSTIHAYKGSEADRVFLIDTRDDSFLTNHDEDADYARRLFYVAVSRARNEITLLEV